MMILRLVLRRRLMFTSAMSGLCTDAWIHLCMTDHLSPHSRVLQLFFLSFLAPSAYRVVGWVYQVGWLAEWGLVFIGERSLCRGGHFAHGSPVFSRFFFFFFPVSFNHIHFPKAGSTELSCWCVYIGLGISGWVRARA